MQLDLSTDYTVWDNTTAIVYQAFSKRGSQQDYIDTAKRRAVNKRELAASNGAYQAGDVVFIIPAALYSANRPPRPGDIITHPATSEGEDFTVLAAEGGKLDQAGDYQTHKLTTRNLAIAYGLEDEINIERSGIGQDVAGATTRLWPSGGGEKGGQLLYEALRCRVQPEESARAEEHGIGGQRQNFTIIVSKQLPDLHARECRILWEGTYLEITSYKNAEQIGELPAIRAQRKVT